MKYVITFCPDVEEILLKQMREYFRDEIKFGSMYPNYANIRIDLTHPFAFLFDKEINNTPIPNDLFPSITIVVTNDTKPVELKPLLHPKKITIDEIKDIENNRELYLVPDADLEALKTFIQANEYSWSEGTGTMRRAAISIEVWTDNPQLKNKIYDLVYAFFVGKKRYEIDEIYSVKLFEEQLNGQRSGNYNFDFGKMYFGGMIGIPADYPLNQYFVNTEIKTIAGVDHTYKEIGYGSS